MISGGSKSRQSPEIAGLREVSRSTVHPHVFASPEREVGGILVGAIPNGGGLPALFGAIPAIGAEEHEAALTFTHDAWQHVYRCLESDFSDDHAIVGWYHSHPAFGIFLSDHDVFIHRNFFPGPSQIALVVDPVMRREGVFVWRGTDIVSLLERCVTPGAEPS